MVELGLYPQSALQAPPCGKCHRKRSVGLIAPLNYAWVCAACEMHVLAPAQSVDGLVVLGSSVGFFYSHNKMRLGHGNGSWLTGVVRLMVHMHAVSKTTMLEENDHT